MENIDLGRLSSGVLTEVRTVLSRAETAVGTIERNPNLVLRYRRTRWENGEPIVVDPGERIIHPDVEEMLAVLTFSAEKLSKWRKTGPARHKEGRLGVPT